MLLKFPKIFIGTKLGYLTVENITKPTKSSIWYYFICDCGAKVKLSKNAVRTRIIKNNLDCGCINPNKIQTKQNNIIGSKIGRLTVLSKSDKKSNRVYFKCVCDCGNETNVLSTTLFRKLVVSCGCYTIEKNKTRTTGYKDISGSYWNHTKNSAERRGLDFEVKLEEAWDKFIQQKGLCALSGIEIKFANSYDDATNQTASIDRIDSLKGYISGNIQWVHKHINKIKQDFSDDYFIELCKNVTKNQSNTRPSFHEYFLSLAFVVSCRSEDPDTKHGSVAVSRDNHVIIGTGYNGLIRGANPNNFNLNRPFKYDVMCHSEVNCILNCSIPPRTYPGGVDLYVSGKPCTDCLQFIYQAGIDTIYMAKRQGTKLESKETEDLFNKIVNEVGINIIELDINNSWLAQIL